MKEIKIKQYTVDDIYVSVLTARLVRHADGWSKFEKVEKFFPPTESLLLNLLGQSLMADSRFTATEFAEAIGADQKAVSMMVRWLTGLTLHDFLLEYRKRQVVEYLTCTDLTVGEIAERTGFGSQPSLTRYFRKETGSLPRRYRLLHRPKNFAELYRWE